LGWLATACHRHASRVLCTGRNALLAFIAGSTFPPPVDQKIFDEHPLAINLPTGRPWAAMPEGRKQGSARSPSPNPNPDSGAADFTHSPIFGPKVQSPVRVGLRIPPSPNLMSDSALASKSKSKSKVQFEMDFEVQVKKAKVRSELDFFELRSPSPSSSPRKRKMEQEAKEAGARSGLFLTGVILCVRPFQPRLTADCSN
jgi:hypothetical protein